MYQLTDYAGAFQQEVNRICRQDGDEDQKDSETQICPIFFLFYDINSILFDLIQKEDIYVDLKGFRLESPLYHGQTLAAQTRPHCANNHAVPACQETGSAAYRYVIKFTYYTCI